MFRDRRDAGEQLARAVPGSLSSRDPVVLALPRGGVPVAAPVAGALRAPLDVLVVRKLGLPGHEELAMGAVASGGALVRNEDVAGTVSQEVFDEVLDRERAELARREHDLRGARPALEVGGREVVVVDDGLATGATMRVALATLRSRGAGRLVVAVPVAPRRACALLAEEAAAVVCLRTPHPFDAVGASYAHFEPPGRRTLLALLR